VSDVLAGVRKSLTTCVWSQRLAFNTALRLKCSVLLLAGCVTNTSGVFSIVFLFAAA